MTDNIYESTTLICTCNRNIRINPPCTNDFNAFFFFNDTATTEIYTLSLHDALPISIRCACGRNPEVERYEDRRQQGHRSEEHTSELQSQFHLVCRLLLEKKKKIYDFALFNLSLYVYSRGSLNIHLYLVCHRTFMTYR